MRQTARRMRTIVGLAALTAVTAMADTVVVGTIERKDVTVSAVRDGQVEFSVGGRQVDPVPAERVTRILVDSEPDFTKAENAFAGEKWDVAAAGYAQAMRTTTKDWIKAWALPRMMQAAQKAGKFGIAVDGFVALLDVNPALAMKLRPTVPAGADAATLSGAAAAIQKAAGNVNYSATQKQAALTLLMDVYRAQGNLTEAGKVGEQLLKIAPADARDPANAQVTAGIRLAVAQLALAEKNYAKVLEQIEAAKALFSEPAMQAEALFVVAAAKDGQAGAQASGDALRDVAIEYMRAAAAGRGAGGVKVAESLMRVGAIEKQLGNKKAAATLYGEVAAMKDNSLSAQAAQELAGLKD